MMLKNAKMEGGGSKIGGITGQTEPVKGTHSWTMVDETGAMRETKSEHERAVPGQGNTRCKARQTK